MKILVTGAAGFIGSYLSRALVWRGDDVYGFDNFHEFYPRSCKEFNIDLTNLAAGRSVQFFPKQTIDPIYTKLIEYTDKKISPNRGFYTFIEGDIRNFEFLEYLFEKHQFDAVIHLAAMAGVPISLKEPRLYTSVNVDGTINLLNLSARSGIKNFVFASSSSVYGNSDKTPFKEQDCDNRPISPYASTKLAGEVLCHTFHYNFKMPISCLRFFTVYGPLQRRYNMAIQKFISQIYKGSPITIFGDGSMARDYTYVEDTVSGIIGALDKKSDYEIFNLGNSHPVSLLELVKIIEKHIKMEVKVEFVNRPSTEVNITYADSSKAKDKLGYNPKISADEGVRRQIEMFMLMPQWYRDLVTI